MVSRTKQYLEDTAPQLLHQVTSQDDMRLSAANTCAEAKNELDNDDFIEAV